MSRANDPSDSHKTLRDGSRKVLQTRANFKRSDLLPFTFHCGINRYSHMFPKISGICRQWCMGGRLVENNQVVLPRLRLLVVYSCHREHNPLLDWTKG